MGYKKTTKEIFESRLQMILSRTLLRSMHLHESAIREINANNIVGLFTILKSLIEIPAVLGYILYLLNSKITPTERFNLLAEIYLGNRGNGELSV